MQTKRSTDSPVQGDTPSPALALPISKLRGVPPQARTALKRRRINTCGRLLEEAGDASRRTSLAQAARIDHELLEQLVQRADLARVNGVGAVFCLMLEEVGVRDVATLARQDPDALCEQLRAWNAQERLARRSPTPEEVGAWVEQARGLPVLVSY